MWFKNAQILPLDHTLTLNAEILETQLAQLTFRPCAPTLPHSAGWVSPLDQEEAPLIHVAKHYLLICLQIEEKLLPTTVVRQALTEKVKTLEAKYDRKIRAREKNAMKDEITQTLMPRAFTKLTRLYAYIDTKNHWLILDTTNTAKTEMFLTLLKKSVESLELADLDLKKIPSLMAHWLREESYPKSISIEKSVALQDPNNKNRIIRVTQEDLFSKNIQSLLKEGFDVMQLALNWNNQILFTLFGDFSLRSIKYQDAVIELANENYSETAAQKFDTDFIIMSESLTRLIKDLLTICQKTSQKSTSEVAE